MIHKSLILKNLKILQRDSTRHECLVFCDLEFDLIFVTEVTIDSHF